VFGKALGKQATISSSPDTLSEPEPGHPSASTALHATSPADELQPLMLEVNPGFEITLAALGWRQTQVLVVQAA
jgi:hypothetical protein